MPHVERTDPDGVDYGWVMQTTFVVAIAVGAPLVAVASLFVPSLNTWPARAEFAIRVGAVLWVVIAVSVFLYARSRVE
ncbi:DUF5822 domain-containing protein [Halomarina salina]|uniref:DUF5822 domain-containing protein n=1 Tax=Halomarina salina TaxID=1872699 RepID=A0ABD5RQL1_9EURY